MSLDAFYNDPASVFKYLRLSFMTFDKMENYGDFGGFELGEMLDFILNGFSLDVDIF